MKHKRLRWFIVAVAIQLAILLGLAGRHLFTVITGTPVLLQTEAVDPWDMFRGDYVRLNFAISTLPLPSGQDRLNRLEKVWVVLQPPEAGEKYWTAKTVSRQRPAVQPGEVT